MDLKVAVQRSKAYALAAILGMAFYPASVKASVLGWMIDRTTQYRLELKVRDFESAQFDSTLIEEKLINRLGNPKGTVTWYAESFSDGSFILFKDIHSIVAQFGWTEAEMNKTTVLSKSKKQSKRCAYVPYSQGQLIHPTALENANPTERHPNSLF